MIIHECSFALESMTSARVELNFNAYRVSDSF